MRADFTLDYDVLTVERAQTIYLMARLISDPAPDDQQRRPLNLSVVIDRSGSMAGDKLDFTRQAAQFLVQNLGARDILSVVLYNDRVETLLEPGHVLHKDLISQRIGNIHASGTTNLSGGWLEGCRHVGDNLNEKSLNRVILMTDGLANRGVTDPGKLVNLVSQKRGEDITTSTMGLGTDFNEDLLMALANAGGGAFYFIESPEVTPLIFQEELQGLLSVVGQNLTICVEAGEHVTEVKQLNAYPMHQDGDQTQFRLGDVYGDEVKALMLELTVPGLAEIGQQQIALLRFDYDELTPEGSQHRTWELPVMVNVRHADEQPRLANPEVRESMLLLKAAQARRAAVDLADKGEYQQASQILREAADAIAGEDDPSERLIEEKEALMSQVQEMDRGAEFYSQYSRKTMATQAFYTMNSRHDETMFLRMREQNRQPNPTANPEEEAPAVVSAPGVTPTGVTWRDKSFPLEGDLIRIGRSQHNEIVIRAHGVSRFHCHVKREGEHLVIEDLGSTNGTWVRGQQLDGPFTLSVGDEVYLSGEKLVFHASP